MEEAYAVTGNIEGKLATLQATQQNLQDDSAGVVTKKTIEDVKQATSQCTAKVAIIQVELEEIHDVCVGGLLGVGSPKGNFGAKSPCLNQFW